MNNATPQVGRRVLVTGAAGQDGAYLCRDLLGQGYEVHTALPADSALESPWRWRELAIADHPALHVHRLDLRDAERCRVFLSALEPEQIFHLAAISSVAEGHAAPLRVFEANALVCVNLLDALRRLGNGASFIYAASSEMYSNGPVDEASRPLARHPYALSKLAGHAAVGCFRDSFGLRASSAILFNHESPLRGAAFVTRKLAAAAARPDAEPIALGNLDAHRDFGYAPEYVQALQMMALRATAQDFVLATGVLTSIREFATRIYAAAGMDLEWRGQGSAETAHDAADGRLKLRIDSALWRPSDDAMICGDARLARTQLGFAPVTDVTTLARLMLDAERRRVAELPSSSPI
ncbi:MAG: GDP-mannose 4,6-dehydratase [Tahibacter sp.]